MLRCDISEMHPDLKNCVLASQLSASLFGGSHIFSIKIPKQWLKEGALPTKYIL